MKVERPATDSLLVEFRARCNPLAEGDAGLDPFFDALEAHAGEWMPEKVGRRRSNYSRVSTLKALKKPITPGGTLGLTLWADVLSILLHHEIADSFKARPEALTDLDLRLWMEKFPDFYEREKIDGTLFPSVGAYLGEMLVRRSPRPYLRQESSTRRFFARPSGVSLSATGLLLP